MSVSSGGETSSRSLTSAEGSGEEEDVDLGEVTKTVKFEGMGARPKPGNIARFHIRGTLLDGRDFENSRLRCGPMQMRIGTGQLVAGVDRALLSMRAGERSVFRVPAEEGYGELGMPPRVPPSSTTTWDVELIDFREAPVRSLHTVRVVELG